MREKTKIKSYYRCMFRQKSYEKKYTGNLDWERYSTIPKSLIPEIKRVSEEEGLDPRALSVWLNSCYRELYYRAQQRGVGITMSKEYCISEILKHGFKRYGYSSGLGGDSLVWNRVNDEGPYDETSYLDTQKNNIKTMTQRVYTDEFLSERSKRVQNTIRNKTDEEKQMTKDKQKKSRKKYLSEIPKEQLTEYSKKGWTTRRS